MGALHSDRPNPAIRSEDVFESGGELFLAVGYTPGGAPFGPRAEIIDGELVFPEETDPHTGWNDRPDENPF